MDISSRKSLAISLSKLSGFRQPDVRKEQYLTDSDVAATILWHASMHGDIAGKTIADLGAGTGILGIGALHLDAKHVYFVESAPVPELRENVASYQRFTIVANDVRSFTKAVDVVLENPPFGTRERHIDREFLEHAMTIAPVIYSFHKTTTAPFFETLAKIRGFTVTYRHDFSFPLRQSYAHHRKRIAHIAVTCFRFEKNI
jgi:putative methylase